ncbi:MAG: hypothetical protein KGP14_14435, partial [Betaproteobacteria bacterium]|nr:hypothetical protein [Betaproteobacteria bacterium]
METTSIIVTWLTATGERILVKHDDRMVIVQLDTWMMPVAVREADQFIKTLQDNKHRTLQIENGDERSPKLSAGEV